MGDGEMDFVAVNTESMKAQGGTIAVTLMSARDSVTIPILQMKQEKKKV